MTDYVFPTGQDIIHEAQDIIGEVAGPGVQVYSEDQTYSALRRAFDLVFIKRPWEQYQRWGQYTIDGVSGKLSDANPFGDVVSPDLSDFIYVGLDSEQRPLSILNNRINPLTFTGTVARAWTSLPVSDVDFKKKRLLFWPLQSTNKVNVLVRLRPQTIIDNTPIFMDRLMMVMGTAWQVLDFDGSNPGAADTCKQLYDLRFRDIENALSSQPLEVANDRGIPTDWFTHP